MKILIVHDREVVSSQIRSLLEDLLGVVARVDLAADYQTAREALRGEIYDFLLVDLTIPFFKGGVSPDFSAVDKLLVELFNHATLNVPGDVIGLTQDRSALDLITNSIGKHLMVIIEEDAEGRWKALLADKIKYAQRAAETRSVVVNRHYHYDALVLTAMDKELAPYKEIFEFSDIKHFPGAKQFLFEDRIGQVRKGVAFSVGRSGQPPAASMAQSLISSFRPKLALMSGYCGGVKGKVKFGDLVFFEAAYAWDYGKWTESEEPNPKSVFSSRPNPIDISRLKTHAVAREIRESDLCKQPAFLRKVGYLSKGKIAAVDSHICPVGSGSAVVANDEIVAQIRGLNETIWAVDMESYGFYYAAQHTHVVKPEFICLKSVSDYCNGEKGDELHEACSYISASVATEILMKHWEF